MKMKIKYKSLSPYCIILLLFFQFTLSNSLDLSTYDNYKNFTCEDIHKIPDIDKCDFVKSNCASQKIGFLNYLSLYYCKSQKNSFFHLLLSKSSIILILITILFLIILFTTLGLTASDYLCPNLNSISKFLQLNENITGLTLLALGNGSPDIFSTFTAMKIGSGSLAIGELIGAAFFIVSVVIGSLAILKPFKIYKKTFLRDVIFFTFSILILDYQLLIKRNLSLWFCFNLIMLYLVYVFLILIWNFISMKILKKKKMELKSRSFYSNDINNSINSNYVVDNIKNTSEINPDNNNDDNDDNDDDDDERIPDIDELIPDPSQQPKTVTRESTINLNLNPFISSSSSCSYPNSIKNNNNNNLNFNNNNNNNNTTIITATTTNNSTTIPTFAINNDSTNIHQNIIKNSSLNADTSSLSINSFNLFNNLIDLENNSIADDDYNEEDELIGSSTILLRPSLLNALEFKQTVENLKKNNNLPFFGYINNNINNDNIINNLNFTNNNASDISIKTQPQPHFQLNVFDNNDNDNDIEFHNNNHNNNNCTDNINDNNNNSRSLSLPSTANKKSARRSYHSRKSHVSNIDFDSNVDDMTLSPLALNTEPKQKLQTISLPKTPSPVSLILSSPSSPSDSACSSSSSTMPPKETHENSLHLIDLHNHIVSFDKSTIRPTTEPFYNDKNFSRRRNYKKLIVLNSQPLYKDNPGNTFNDMDLEIANDFKMPLDFSLNQDKDDNSIDNSTSSSKLLPAVSNISADYNSIHNTIDSDDNKVRKTDSNLNPDVFKSFNGSTQVSPISVEQYESSISHIHNDSHPDGLLKSTNTNESNNQLLSPSHINNANGSPFNVGRSRSSSNITIYSLDLDGEETSNSLFNKIKKLIIGKRLSNISNGNHSQSNQASIITTRRRRRRRSNLHISSSKPLKDRILTNIIHILFPSFLNFSEKSLIDQSLLILVSPIVLLLRLSIPVRDYHKDIKSDVKTVYKLIKLKHLNDTNVHMNNNVTSPELNPSTSNYLSPSLQAVEDSISFAGFDGEFNESSTASIPISNYVNQLVLLAAQSVLSPFILIYFMFSTNDESDEDGVPLYLYLIGMIISILMLSMVTYTFHPKKISLYEIIKHKLFDKDSECEFQFQAKPKSYQNRTSRNLINELSKDSFIINNLKFKNIANFILSFVGFLVSISWISVIATEVIAILKFYAIIWHLSDAILGITVFAIGNSLGDFISNFTIAKMGFPRMALAACVGGPLLNILIGIGGSGLIIIPNKEYQRQLPNIIENGMDYKVELSSTLIVSNLALLVNLIFLLVAVPSNDWKMNRFIGITMISIWATATTFNVLIEIFV
ncbi:uncharacterized protein ASCRUDRAFT_83999 [Ascoidea rubescens DSM 1968]|uniref:Sodium/calcium exchanger membrane region domain-containing protein n=1 Tax=Ascoidea rubescens DSM 1968 TaxID=1344418 RepID=A0A1D2VRA7_9ASCO|nr:hypothetical protein ASCRUDRAFT_83999 [Ascoidea rubescens DSM 1968]ODV64146.1 hypothetical protein ASCRUDRAFT_83999 [Ascoidea rubescens DSM 1968]